MEAEKIYTYAITLAARDFAAYLDRKAAADAYDFSNVELQYAFYQISTEASRWLQSAEDKARFIGDVFVLPYSTVYRDVCTCAEMLRRDEDVAVPSMPDVKDTLFANAVAIAVDTEKKLQASEKQPSLWTPEQTDVSHDRYNRYIIEPQRERIEGQTALISELFGVDKGWLSDVIIDTALGAEPVISLWEAKEV